MNTWDRKRRENMGEIWIIPYTEAWKRHTNKKSSAPGRLPAHSTDTWPQGNINLRDMKERQKRQSKKKGRWDYFVWQKPSWFLDQEWPCIATESSTDTSKLLLSPPGPRKDITSSSPSASWACQSQSVPGVLPGWDPTPCHPHRRSRHLCRKTEKRETYNGLWSQIHSWMKKALRTGSFDKLSHWGFCPFSAE